MKVFISYSRDSSAHEKKVLSLAGQLRHSGIDAIIDQYEPFPPQGWIRWMKQQVQSASYVLIVCTETYCRRADGREEPGVGLGAAYETRLIQQLLYDAGGLNERFIPVILAENDRRHIPLELRSYTVYPAHTEVGFSSLCLLLTNQQRVPVPALGQALQVPHANQDFRNNFWNVPPRNPFFTGRSIQLKSLYKKFNHSKSGPVSHTVAISGLGGVGKTQTAIEYAYRYRASYRAGLWIVADSLNNLLSGLAGIASLLDLPEKNQDDLSIVAAAVRRWLESNSDWLLTLDNVEDLSLVRKFTPPDPHGHLLITTQHHAIGEIGETIELPKMNQDEGALFLLRRSKVISRKQSLASADGDQTKKARLISSRMDGLPLALDQVAAFVEETPSSLQEYLALYDAEGRTLRAKRGDLSFDHPSVTVTFSLALGRLRGESESAAELVNLCAFLSPLPIPEELLSKGAPSMGEVLRPAAEDPLRLLELIREATRLSLIQRNTQEKSITMHRLIQTVIQDEMSEPMRRTWAERAVNSVQLAFPDPDYQNWASCDRLLSHALHVSKLIEGMPIETMGSARLLNDVGGYLLGRALYTEAQNTLEMAAGIFEKVLPPGGLLPLAKCLLQLAEAYRSQGHYSKSEPVFIRALRISEDELGPDHPETGIVLQYLALLYRRQGRFQEAIELLTRSLGNFTRAEGRNQEYTATTLNHLAVISSDEDRFEDAEKLFLSAYAIRKDILGSDHPDTAATLYGLARLYRAQGRIDEAEPLARQAHEVWERVYGSNHPFVADSLHNLGEIERIQGQAGAARRTLERAIAIWEGVLGADHPHTAIGLSSLAKVHSDLGSFVEAELLFSRALAIFDSTVGSSHPDAIRIRDSYIDFRRRVLEATDRQD